jgi:hypothetical protein
MPKQREIDPGASVHAIIVGLLIATLPPDLRAAAPDLAHGVMDHPDVERHAGKRRGELSESEGNIVAREVGLVARDVMNGAGYVSASGGEHLH